MKDTDADLIEIVLVIDFIVSLLIVLFFVIFTQPPDDSMLPLYVGIITFVVLVVAEFLCWLFHIPAWIHKGLMWIHDKTEPKEDSHADS